MPSVAFCTSVSMALLVVLGNLVGLFELLDDVETVAADVAHGDLGRFGVFMCDLHQFLAALGR